MGNKGTIPKLHMYIIDPNNPEMALKVGETMETMTTPYYALPTGGTLNDILGEKPFWKGNIMKYIWRAGDKPDVDELEDLEKALDCLNNRIEKLRRRNQSANTSNMLNIVFEETDIA